MANVYTRTNTHTHARYERRKTRIGKMNSEKRVAANGTDNSEKATHAVACARKIALHVAFVFPVPIDLLKTE